jgi:hypothetical protein
MKIAGGTASDLSAEGERITIGERRLQRFLRARTEFQSRKELVAQLQGD